MNPDPGESDGRRGAPKRTDGITMITKVQTLLYHTDPVSIGKFFECMGTIIIAPEDHVYLHIGDCSASRLLDEEAVEYWTATLGTFKIEFHYTFFGDNLGFARGHNSLFREIPTGDRLLILNPDAVFPADLIARANIFADACMDFGIADIRQIPLEHPKAFNPITYETDWSSGACCLIDAQAFQAVSGFDETFFMYCEDVDLSWRIRAAGYRAYYCVETFLYHDKRLLIAGPEPSDTEYYYGILNSMLLRAKYDRVELNKPILRWLRKSKNPLHDKIITQYRLANKELPTVTDNERKVASFTKEGEFSRHRWHY